MEIAITLIVIGSILFLAYFFSFLFKKVNIPDVLPLFLIGLVMGPITGLVKPDFFGKTGEIFASFTLIIILFESGLDISIKSLFRSFGSAFLLSLLTFFGTVPFLTLLSHSIFGISYIDGFTIASLLWGTASGIVIPLAENLNLEEKTKTILNLESSLDDIFSIVIIFTLLRVLKNQSINSLQIGKDFAMVVLKSIIFGIVSGFIWSRLLEKIRTMKNSIFTTPALAFILYGLAELLKANGALAVSAFGITLGNIETSLKKNHPSEKFYFTEKEKSFFASLVFLLKTYFFVYIGISIKITAWSVLWGIFATLSFFLIRKLATEITFRNSMPQFDRNIVASMFPKGLTVAAILTLINKPLLTSISYPIILFSIIFSSLFIFITKRREDSLLKIKNINPLKNL